MSPHPSFVAVRDVFVEHPAAAAFSVLRQVTVELELGERITLFGTEASGKSTLLRVLVGAIKPTAGIVRVNQQNPAEVKHIAAGYVSSEEREPAYDTVSAILHMFGKTHGIANLPARLGVIGDILALDRVAHRPTRTLSTCERLRVNLARAALSESPLILLDDVVTELGVEATRRFIDQLFTGRTVVVATRQAEAADALDYPLLILQHGTIVERGSISEVALKLACPQVVDVWMEGVRYDVLRQLKNQAGVMEARLLPSNDFMGQRLRLTVRSGRYLPLVYDVVSRHPLIRIDEHPVLLRSVLARMSK